MIRLVCLLIGYLFGLFQTAFFLGKAKGIDIRQHGSGNSGTTNTLRVLGTKAGLIVFFGDCVKAIIAVTLVRILFAGRYPELEYLLCIYTGAGVILGHNYPFYMNFKGGKGIAATAGMVIAFHPYFTIVGILVFFIPFFITHYVSLCSLLVYTTLMIMMVVYGQLGGFPNMSQGVLIEMYILFGCLMLLAIWKHKENVKRLLKGEERKTYLSKKNQV